MYKKVVMFMKKLDEGSVPESIEIAGRQLRFKDTKTGKLHCELTELLIKEVISPELREMLSRYLASSEAAILYNMKAYIVMQQLIEGLMLNQSMTETGKVVSVQFPEQVKILQDSVDRMLTLIGRKINNETSK